MIGTNNQRLPIQKCDKTHSNNRGLVAAKEFLELRKLESSVNQRLQAHCGLVLELRRVLAVSLDVHAHGRTLRPSPAQTENDTRAVVKEYNVPLVLAHAAVDGIGVAKVGRARDGKLAVLRACERRRCKERIEVVRELLCAL
jgi:hypothetical protein